MSQISYTMLQKLINSMSKSEKRFFKIQAQHQQGEKLYLQLFEMVEKQPFGEGERSIKKLFPRYAYLKKYLYDEMTTAIHLYHLDKDDYQRALYHISLADLLADRDLLENALYHNQAAANIADAIDSLHLKTILQQQYLTIKGLELRPTEHHFYLLWERHSQLMKETADNLRLFVQQYSTQIGLNYWQQCKSSGIRVPDRLNIDIQETLALQDKLPQDSPSIIATSFNIRISTEKHVNLRNEHFKELVQFLKTRVQFTQTRASYFVFVCYQACQTALQLKDYDWFLECVQELRNDNPLFKNLSQMYQSYADLAIKVLHTVYAYFKGDYAAASAYLQAFRASEPNKNFLLLHISVNFYEGCLHWKQKQIQQALSSWSIFFGRRFSVYGQYQQGAHCLRLLLLWEQNDWSMLAYFSAQLYRKIYKCRSRHTFIQRLLRFIERSIQRPHRKKEILQKYYAQLSHYFQQRKLSLKHGFDYLQWAENALSTSL